MMNTISRTRVFIIVIDALGVGALPDAGDYGDSLAVNTLSGIDREAGTFSLPTLEKMGLGNIIPLTRVSPNPQPTAAFGKMAEYSKGKDTTTGHWEMMGIYLDEPFPTYPNGFPPEIIARFLAETGCLEILGNVPASGTEILKQLGLKHLETGYPIVYTSADSVFQIAAHVDKVPLETLYFWCETARNILQGHHQVSRVIARSFRGESGSFQRIGGDRRDYAVTPPVRNALMEIRNQGGITIGIGKIEDIFCKAGITHALHTQGNTHGLQVIRDLITGQVPLNQLSLEGKPLCDYLYPERQLIFVNLVDTDMNYGHRRDVDGYAGALTEIDEALADILPQLGEGDLLMITGDHGCDPTAPGSDHTREYVPILMYNHKALTDTNGQKDMALGVRHSFADIGQTALAWLGFSGEGLPGTCMLNF